MSPLRGWTAKSVAAPQSGPLPSALCFWYRNMNVYEVGQKGLENVASLTEMEWPIYIVSYFECIADMEGWDHFYLYNMEWYPLLVDFLEQACDQASLSVLRDYEHHFVRLDVGFNSIEIGGFLNAPPKDYLANCPDWRDKFEVTSAQRWKLIQLHYNSHDIKLDLDGWL
jgi:hypothetical protein